MSCYDRSRRLRFAHSRFHKGKPVCKGEKFDRVVTSVWTFDTDVSILTYGATVFKKENRGDHWSRRAHVKQAVERFNDNPLRIKLIRPVWLRELLVEIDSIPMDWYIATNLIYKFGTQSKSDEQIEKTVDIPFDFNTRYSRLADKYEQKEKLRQERMEESAERYKMEQEISRLRWENEDTLQVFCVNLVIEILILGSLVGIGLIQYLG